MDKVICPKCGNKLVVWQEWMYTKYFPVNPKTGEVANICGKSTKSEPVEGMEGLECLTCGWRVNTVFDDLKDKEGELFEALKPKR